MDPYERIDNLYKIDRLDNLITRRRSELIMMQDLSQDLINEYLALRVIILKDLSKVKTREDLLRIFHALRLDYYIKDPSKVSSEDLYDSVVQHEELFNRP
jgi:hypothetical protein